MGFTYREPNKDRFTFNGIMHTFTQLLFAATKHIYPFASAAPFSSFAFFAPIHMDSFRSVNKKELGFFF
jgi:hypothetical protein